MASATLSWGTFSQFSIAVQRRALCGSLSFNSPCSRHLRAHLGLERLAQALSAVRKLPTLPWVLMTFGSNLWVRHFLTSEAAHARL